MYSVKTSTISKDIFSIQNTYFPCQLVPGIPLTTQKADVHEEIKKKRSPLKHDTLFTINSEKSLKLSTDEHLTENIPARIEIDDEFEKFKRRLNVTDMDILQRSLNNIMNISFVKKIEFKELETPTIIIRLSEMNTEVEEKIYKIEYDLLKCFKDSVDFLVFPI